MMPEAYRLFVHPLAPVIKYYNKYNHQTTSVRVARSPNIPQATKSNANKKKKLSSERAVHF